MKSTVIYEMNYLYSDSTVYGSYKVDAEMSVPSREITREKAESIIGLLKFQRAAHYETSKADFYEVAIDSRHTKQYVFYK
jgi:hypothetical protein